MTTPYKLVVTSSGTGDVILEYVLNDPDGNWIEATVNSSSPLEVQAPNGEGILVRGSNKNVGTFKKLNNNNLPTEGLNFSFEKLTPEGEDFKIKAVGNILSLVNHEWVNNSTLREEQIGTNYEGKIGNISLGGLFKNNTYIEDVTDLYLNIDDKVPVYKELFSGCTSLNKAQFSLSATTLSDNCYNSMFSNCTSLTASPYLPATSLTNGCYSNMFVHCTSLRKPPKLPAKKLTNNCYSHMFENCESLEFPPLLLATVLANDCYVDMFGNIEPNIISKEQIDAFLYPYNFPESVLNESNKPKFIFSNSIIDDTTTQYYIKFGSYITWDEFEAYNKTWDEWEALNLTWNELEVYGVTEGVI